MQPTGRNLRSANGQNANDPLDATLKLTACRFLAAHSAAGEGPNVYRVVLQKMRWSGEQYRSSRGSNPRSHQQNVTIVCIMRDDGVCAEHRLALWRGRQCLAIRLRRSIEHEGVVDKLQSRQFL